MYTPLVENFGASEKEEDKEVFRRITEHNVPMGKMGGESSLEAEKEGMGGHSF